MALIRMQTNMNVFEDRVGLFTKKIIKAVAPALGEPETEIRVEIMGSRKMRMATSDEPIAHMEIRNVEVPKDHGDALAKAICPVVESVFAIQSHNVYIAVVSNHNTMWRISGGTVGDTRKLGEIEP